MLSQNTAEPQTSQPSGAQAGAAGAPVPPMDSGSTIEAASTGDGTINNPGATDNKPPGIGDKDHLLQFLG